jgi:hypothetical protein
MDIVNMEISYYKERLSQLDHDYFDETLKIFAVIYNLYLKCLIVKV